MSSNYAEDHLSVHTLVAPPSKAPRNHLHHWDMAKVVFSVASWPIKVRAVQVLLLRDLQSNNLHHNSILYNHLLHQLDSLKVLHSHQVHSQVTSQHQL